MKRFSTSLLPILLLAISAAMTGCLKDKNFDNGSIQSVHNNGQNENVIEIQLTATSADNFLLTAFDASNVDTVFNLIPVVLNAPTGAKEDINVTLAPNPGLLADYNTANGTSYAIPDNSMYTLVSPGLTVKIPAGSRVGYLQIKFKPSTFLGGDWAFAYSIASIDKPAYAISGNLKNGIAAIIIKNQYDGKYKSQGNFTHPVAANTSSWLFGDGIVRDLVTSSATAVYIYPLETAAVTFGVELDLTINGDNTVRTDFVGTTDDPDAVPNPSYYNPATRSFHIDAWYGGHTRHLVDSLVYIGPR